MYERVFTRWTLTTALLALPCLAATGPALIDAIKEHNHKLAATLIAQHADVNAAQPDGATPLAWAVYLDQTDIVDLLMKAGAKANTADEYGETPLTLACATGNAAVMEKLLTAGADATAARWNGETALMIASRAGSVAGVKLLLAHGAKIDAAESRKGQNALMWAAAEGHGDVVDLLLRSGADVKMISKGGYTPLAFAVPKGDVNSVRSLLDAGLSANYKVSNGTSLLQAAVTGGKPAVVQALLEHNADVNTAGKGGLTPLHVAAQAGSLEIVKLLLAKGANPNALTAKVTARGRNPLQVPVGEQTALMLAAKENHEDVMRALVAGGADSKIKAQDGTTLLMAAAGSGHLSTVKYAYELDADVNALTTRKSSVIHAAVTTFMDKSTQADICSVIEFLAAHGADVDTVDTSGHTPIFIASLLPIDKAVTLMTKLITDSGRTPKEPEQR
ncbi:MAG: ankyrin repeat domain-containing protein [Bryobacteraceae bacterium]